MKENIITNSIHDNTHDNKRYVYAFSVNGLLLSEILLVIAIVEDIVAISNKIMEINIIITSMCVYSIYLYNKKWATVKMEKNMTKVYVILYVKMDLLG
jgi:hypothetical protein